MSQSQEKNIKISNFLNELDRNIMEENLLDNEISLKTLFHRNLFIKNSIPSLTDNFSNYNASGRSQVDVHLRSPNTSSKSRINQRSQKIVERLQRKGRYSPLFKRSINEDESRLIKLEQTRDKQNLKNEEELATYTYKPQLNESKSNERTVENFLTDMDNWQKNKDEKITLMKKEKDSRQNIPTFRPAIDENSQKIMSLDTKENHEYRILRKNICQDKQEKFPFHPKINPNSNTIALKNRTDQPVEERLYKNEKVQSYLSRSTQNINIQKSQILEQSKIRNEYKLMWQRLSEIQQCNDTVKVQEEQESFRQQKEIFPIYLEVKDFSATHKQIQEREHLIDMDNYKFIYEKLNMYDNYES